HLPAQTTAEPIPEALVPDHPIVGGKSPFPPDPFRPHPLHPGGRSAASSGTAAEQASGLDFLLSIPRLRDHPCQQSDSPLHPAAAGDAPCPIVGQRGGGVSLPPPDALPRKHPEELLHIGGRKPLLPLPIRFRPGKHQQLLGRRRTQEEGGELPPPPLLGGGDEHLLVPQAVRFLIGE